MPMICVKTPLTNNPTVEEWIVFRTTIEKAKKLVAAGTHFYCSRKMWKEHGRARQ